MYQFSAPMPFSKALIDKLIDINNEVEKSRITSFYFSLPSTCELFTIFEQYRNDFIEHSDFSFWTDLMKYSIDKGVDFIYNLNNPKNLPIENQTFDYELEKLDILLNELREIGVNKLRVSNHKLIAYLAQKYEHFTLYASTSFEFKLIKEYQHFIEIHPEVKQIVPSHDVNKNFELLKNLKKSAPYVDIEIMVNEGCIGGCAMRYDHSCEIMGKYIETKYSFLSNGFYGCKCGKTIDQNPLLYLCKSQIIYPWEINEYRKIGINKFKLSGREDFKHDMEKSVNSYLLYLKGVDDVKNIGAESINSIIHHISQNRYFNKFKIKDIKNFLPNIKHFVKKGHLCSSKCGICNYCSNCKKRIEKAYETQFEQEKKKQMPMCVINKGLNNAKKDVSIFGTNAI